MSGHGILLFIYQEMDFGEDQASTSSSSGACGGVSLPLKPSHAYAIAKGLSFEASLTCTCIAELLNRLLQLRKREFSIDPDDFTVVTTKDQMGWAKIFAEYSIGNAHCTVAHCSAHADDMLWYVKHITGFFLGGNKPPCLDVLRRQSKKHPVPGDAAVNWEETVYLNLVLQQIDYIVTCAVCTKTSTQNLQILRKNTQRVYASPSRRRMDSKGESEEMTYPHIYFSIDDFEQVFGDVVIRDGECVCVELIARDRYGGRESALFLGSIRYEVLKQVYDSKASSGTWQWASRLVSSTDKRRQEFVRMRGPHGKGFAEMAVARVPGCGYETPTAEQATPMHDFEVQVAEAYRKRRMSENNLTGMYMRMRGSPVRKAQSDADCMAQYPEIEANSLDDELEEGVFGRLWTMRGFGQAWHWLREKRRAASTPLNAYLTYVTLPCQTIIDDFLEHPRRPVLTFDTETPTLQSDS